MGKVQIRKVKILKSVSKHPYSEILLRIFPGEKTPRHFHREFSESFRIISGALELGVGDKRYILRTGDEMTIPANEIHYFHNIWTEECIVQVRVEMGNKNFEKALLLLSSLHASGWIGKDGSPRRFKDLALFVYLNNSFSIGVRSWFEPFLWYVAKRAIAKGYLEEQLKAHDDVVL